MEPAVGKMEAQLKLWSLKIERLAAKTQEAGVRTGFDALMYIDELKVLHAIAQSKLDELGAAEEPRRARLQAEMKSAWDDLDAAFEKPMPWASAGKSLSARRIVDSAESSVDKRQEHQG